MTPNPGNANPGGTSTERLRERFQQQFNRDDKTPTNPLPGTDRRPRLPENKTPSMPNLDSIRERLESRKPRSERPETELKQKVDPPDRSDFDRLRERMESRKPDLGRPDTELKQKVDPRPDMSDLERLRDRFRDRNENRPELPNLGNRGDDDNDRRPRFPGLNPGNDNRGTFESKLGLFHRDENRDQWKILSQKFDPDHAGRQEFAERLKSNRRIDRIQDHEELRERLERFQNSDEVREALQRNRLKVTDLSGAFQERIHRRDAFRHIAHTNVGRRFNIDQQFSLFGKGDITRRLDLNHRLMRNGGWSKRVVGPVYSGFTSRHFSAWYPGPSWYPRYCWTPTWSSWVRWTFWDYCRPIYDPRPFICRPIYYYDPCPPLVSYNYPTWQPLPVVASGTWIDVPVVTVPAGDDVQLLAVRFVDPGHPEENLGPRYRVWIRNNSNAAVTSPFNVTLVASNDGNLLPGLPEAGITVDALEPNAVVPVDIRLPMDANRMNSGPDGQRTPFATLHVLADSHHQLTETDETNNGQMLNRGDILPVDPAAFATEEPSTFPGSMVSLAGEGFGPEPGQLIVISSGREFPAEIHGWYDLGVYFKMPNISVSDDHTAQILVIRGDGAVSNPVTVSLNPGA